MSTITCMSVRKEILKWAFSLYAILNLISMATMSIGAVVLIAVILFTSGNFQTLVIELKEIRRYRPIWIYFVLSLFLTFACICSLLGGLFYPIHYSQGGVNVSFFKDIAKAWYLFWPLLLWVGFKRLEEKDRLSIFKTWIITFGILSIIGIIQYFTGWPRFQKIPFEEGRFHATLFLGHHLSVANIFIFPFFAALEQGRKKGLKDGMLFWAIALLGFFTLIFTYSRMLWLSLFVGIALWFLLTLNWKSSRVRKLWKPALFLLILGVGIASQIPAIQSRFWRNGMGIGERKELWIANWEFFKNRPLTGVGWHHNQELSGYYLMDKYHVQDVFSGHAHNNLLDMLGGTGLLGVLAWLLFCYGACFWICFQVSRGDFQERLSKLDFSKGLICAWFVFHINGLTQVNFWEAKVQHQMAWVIAWCLIWVSDSSQNEKERLKP